MGAQAAALLDAGGAVGDVPPDAPAVGSLRLTAPPAYDLDRVARGHAGVGHPPSAYDGGRLHRVLPAGAARAGVGPAGVLPGGVPVVVHPDLLVEWSVPADADEVRRVLTDVLCLADDLTALHAACDRVPSLSWVRQAGAGRVLRAPTAFEDLAGVLAATNTSYAATRRMLGALLAGGAFPTPDEVLARGEVGLRAAGWGYRAPSLLVLAARAEQVEGWRDPAVPDGDVLTGLRSLPGFGPYAAASALPLLGHRPRPLVLDGWLQQQVGDPSHWHAMGRWAGTGMWLEVTRRRGGSAPRDRRSPTSAGTPGPR